MSNKRKIILDAINSININNINAEVNRLSKRYNNIDLYIDNTNEINRTIETYVSMYDCNIVYDNRTKNILYNIYHEQLINQFDTCRDELNNDRSIITININMCTFCSDRDVKINTTGMLYNKQLNLNENHNKIQLILEIQDTFINDFIKEYFHNNNVYVNTYKVLYDNKYQRNIDNNNKEIFKISTKQKIVADGVIVDLINKNNSNTLSIIFSNDCDFILYNFNNDVLYFHYDTKNEDSKHNFLIPSKYIYNVIIDYIINHCSYNAKTVINYLQYTSKFNAKNILQKLLQSR